MSAAVDSCCPHESHEPRLVVLTGGPGAGKTAVLEVVRKHFCSHIGVLPEAASIVFSGGFPRRPTVPARRAAQRAISRVQVELERMMIEEATVAVALCDRGTIDGLAYWPDSEKSFWEQLGATRERELARYAAVIHLRTPSAESYNHRNPVRTESARDAVEVDERILRAWDGHPRRAIVESTTDFLEKVARVIELIRAELPDCCKHHRVPEIEARNIR
jgi:predicted ATPase